MSLPATLSISNFRQGIRRVVYCEEFKSNINFLSEENQKIFHKKIKFDKIEKAQLNF